MTAGSPPPPSEPQSLSDLLSGLAYAGVGLAQTARAQFPEMVERGRVTVQRRTQLLRMMTKFTLAQGEREAIRRVTRFQQQMERQLAELQADKEREASEAIRRDLEAEVARLEEERSELRRAVEIARAATAKARGDVAPSGVIDVDSTVLDDETAAPAPQGDPVPSASCRPDSPSEANTGVGSSRPDGPEPTVDVRDLAIPGYESLSASQVVPRLAGLTVDELHQVIRYEQANRGRRTVLNRAHELAADT